MAGRRRQHRKGALPAGGATRDERRDGALGRDAAILSCLTMPLARQYARLVGSTWTSKTPVLGWRQFHVVSLRRAGSSWEVELAASVEPARRTWIAVADLWSRDRFTPGWSTLATLRAASTESPSASLAPSQARARDETSSCPSPKGTKHGSVEADSGRTLTRSEDGGRSALRGARSARPRRSRAARALPIDRT